MEDTGPQRCHEVSCVRTLQSQGRERERQWDSWSRPCRPFPDGWGEIADGERGQSVPRDQLMRAPWRCKELPYNVCPSFLFSCVYHGPASSLTPCIPLKRPFYGVPVLRYLRDLSRISSQQQTLPQNIRVGKPLRNDVAVSAFGSGCSCLGDPTAKLVSVVME